MFAPMEDPAAMTLAVSAPEPADELPRLVAITPWIDPVVDTRGHDPRSRYVELFWLGTLGPTATWLLRRLVAGLDEHPDGYRLDLAATARAMGLSYHTGTAGPFGRALARCVMFGIAHQHSDGFAVRRRLPEVARRHLARLPPEVQAAHDQWLATVPTLDDLQRRPAARRRHGRRRRRPRTGRVAARAPRHPGGDRRRPRPRQLTDEPATAAGQAGLA